MREQESRRCLSDNAPEKVAPRRGQERLLPITNELSNYLTMYDITMKEKQAVVIFMVGDRAGKK